MLIIFVIEFSLFAQSLWIPDYMTEYNNEIVKHYCYLFEYSNIKQSYENTTQYTDSKKIPQCAIVS